MLWLDVTKVVSLVGLIVVLGRLGGPMWACVGVGLAFGANAVASLVTIHRLDGVPLGRMLAECGRILLACVAMVLAVWVTRAAVAQVGIKVRGVGLLAEVFAGGLAYSAVVLVVARSSSLDFLALVSNAVRRRATPRLADAE